MKTILFGRIVRLKKKKTIYSYSSVNFDFPNVPRPRLEEVRLIFLFVSPNCCRISREEGGGGVVVAVVVLKHSNDYFRTIFFNRFLLHLYDSNTKL